MLPCILSFSFFPLPVFQRLSFASHLFQHHRHRIVTTHQTLYLMLASTKPSIPSRGLSTALNFPALYPLCVSFFTNPLPWALLHGIGIELAMAAKYLIPRRYFHKSMCRKLYNVQVVKLKKEEEEMYDSRAVGDMSHSRSV